MPDLDRALRIQATINTPGWADIYGLAKDQAQDARDQLYDLMATYPDKLTGKTALKYAARAKALESFLESVEDELKILTPKPAKAGAS